MADSPVKKVHAGQPAEEVLQDADHLFRVIWEHTSEAMALSAPDGTVLAVNPAYCHLYGFTPEEVSVLHTGLFFSLFSLPRISSLNSTMIELLTHE